MARIRVLIVEDSLTVRAKLRSVIEDDPEMELVGEAEDGRQAIELGRSLRPDVVTMDMALPFMSGLAATEYIMAHFPTPILIVSASFNRGEIFKTYDALAAGAVDVLEKPNGDEPEGAWETRFLSTVKLVSRIKVITHPRARQRNWRPDVAQSAPLASYENASPDRPHLIAIGASTGGPSAVVDILKALPAGFPLPILLVIHLNRQFGTAFADWLDAQSAIRAAFATHGEALDATAGRVTLAPPDRHMIVRNGRIELSDAAERFSCRPSVDVLFESIAADYGSSAAAFLLTGMGRDGAAGLLAIRRAGGTTIAQDEATSVVYGMPREAVMLGAAGRVLPLPEIAPAILALAGAKRRTQ
jgi:two-component system chemotaxis response regulator CheB